MNETLTPEQARLALEEQAARMAADPGYTSSLEELLRRLEIGSEYVSVMLGRPCSDNDPEALSWYKKMFSVAEQAKLWPPPEEKGQTSVSPSGFTPLAANQRRSRWDIPVGGGFHYIANLSKDRLRVLRYECKKQGKRYNATYQIYIGPNGETYVRRES